MQQIERYGVIALVFLLVTIVAVSFWGDSKSPGFWSRLTGRGAKKDASAQTADATAPTGSTGERAIQNDLPMSPATSAPASLVMPIDPAPSTQSSSGAPAAGSSLVAGSPTQTYGAPLTTMTPPAPSYVASAPAPQSTPAPKPIQLASERPASGSSEYVVQKGDNLMLIAARTLGSKNRWTEIRDLNHGVEARSLRVGTKLVLPASASVTKSVAQPKAQEPMKKAAVAPASKGSKASSETYVVRKGDTLKSISERLLGSSARWKDLAAANPRLDPNHISVGTTLHLPESRSTPAPTLVAAAVMPNRSSDRPHVR
jgi:nucleoid-associated protein YgaU